MRGVALAMAMAVAWPCLGGEPQASGEVVLDSTEPLAATADAGEGGTSRSVVVLPIPQASPTLGNGLVLAAVLFSQPEDSPRPWTTGVGVLWTDNGSRGGAVFHKGNRSADAWRYSLFAGGADLRLKFYGVGAAAGSSGVSIPIAQRGKAVQAELLRRFGASTYLGMRMRTVEIETSLRVEPPASRPDLELPGLALESRLAGPGAVLQYDTRDSEQLPTRGTYVDGTLQWNLAAMDSDFGYSKVDVTWNHYRPFGARHVLAVRATGCRTGDAAPFYGLCLYGASNNLRGYETGKYRDQALLALQAEWRMQLTPRWGVVGFAGTGAVAGRFGDLADARRLPSAGMGVRFRASSKFPVNISVDYARARDEDAVYFYIGEAF
ncbi:BamA/TamA family outer membrane protein [Novilysobacter selenitireducens]|uniref:Outer membrane protein assembly factor n=1 Tax=Novilysobacter selenitireducens TaxID=2872639 RepID=A0ABS7T5I4_9GAMM|nr:BamA/TamA family outer membrane protein [Lysobacter selenitireducens]MBZ4039113.1 outer membrane protein assembly factor [Lysobacter selenitireducens]